MTFVTPKYSLNYWFSTETNYIQMRQQFGLSTGIKTCVKNKKCIIKECKWWLWFKKFWIKECEFWILDQICIP